MASGNRRGSRTPSRNGRGRVRIEQRISAVAAVTSVLALLSGLTAYYTGQQIVQQRIAEVRETYVSKQDLENHVQKPLSDVQKDVTDIKTQQAAQGERLREIKEILERRNRNGHAPAASPRRGNP